MKNKFIFTWGGVLINLLLVFSSCDNGSSHLVLPSHGNGSSSAYEMPEDTYSAAENDDGIYINFDLPEGEIARCDVSIEGIGAVAELGFDKNAKNGKFFYPFVTAGKEYEVKFSFTKPEIETDGFVLPQDEYVGLAYFTVKATAGKNSKGEIKLSDKGGVSVTDRGTVFRFVKNPEFTGDGKDAFDKYEWYEDIGLVEGISWEHSYERKTKWLTSIQIEKDNLTKPINLYEQGIINQNKNTIDFLCIRPKMDYSYNGEKFTYQWDNFIFDINYPLQTI